MSATDNYVGSVAGARVLENITGAFQNRSFVDAATANAALNECWVRQPVSMEDYMATNYAGTYASMTKIPDEVIDLINSSSVTSFKNCFAGMAALKMVPYIRTECATDFSGMFQGCTELRVIDPLIDLRKVKTAAGIKDMFKNSSVKFARFGNVYHLEVVQAMTKAWMGSSFEKIVVNGVYGGVKEGA